jgi:hypothetical protein
VNAPRQFRGLRVVLHQQRLEAALKQRPATPVTTIEKAGVP